MRCESQKLIMDTRISRLSSPIHFPPNAAVIKRNSDFTLRDKPKLLELANRIQTKKSSTPNNHQPITPKIPQILPNLKNISTSTTTPLLSKATSSFRRSKLYSSFSPKKRSLHKLYKNDPTKTNIEHLVNIQNHRVINNIPVEFHNSEKLNEVFSPSSSSSSKLCRISRIPIHVRHNGYISVNDQQSTLSEQQQHHCDKIRGIEPEVKTDTVNEAEIQSEVDSLVKIVKPIVIPMIVPSHDQSEELNKVSQRRHRRVKQSNSHELSSRNTGLHEEIYARKRSSSLPKSFLSLKSHLQTPNTNWNKNENIQDAVSNVEKLDQIQLIQPTTIHTKQMGSSNVTNEGRKTSLEYDEQRKVWTEVSQNMEGFQEVPTTVLPIPDSKSSKKSPTKSIRNLSVTHLHLENGSHHETPPNTKSQSLLQRFSKTFSLRFGSSRQIPILPKTPKKIYGSGSTPDIFNISPVHPSSGKSLRNVKCESGDSGIQISDEFESSRENSQTNSSSVSPISMKKLSLVDIPAHDLIQRPIENKHSPPPPTTPKSMRANVIREIIHTEESYVKNLHDIIQGFVIPCRARRDLFSQKTIHNIFSNVEDILKLHIRILQSLNETKDEMNPELSCIGRIFEYWAGDFEIYEEYCMQNPLSNVTVKQLSLNSEYAEFFEACRRLQRMDKLPLHGFLLKPIQRICQYHLQLQELFKQTHSSHEDYEDVKGALEIMKEVARIINNTQRKFDTLQEIVKLQCSIDAWEGRDLVPGNSVILQRGDLVKTGDGFGHKGKDVHVILLNNDLLILKKDQYKKGTLSLNMRIPICSNTWANIDSNEEDEYFGMVHNSWRILEPNGLAWILLTAQNPTEKRKWINAFGKTNQKFPIDMRMSEIAKTTALKLILIESQEDNRNIGSSSSHLFQFPSMSTLPRLRKNRKFNSSLIKSDSEAMITNVGKLRKSNQNLSINSNQISQSRPHSKFYI